MKVTLPVLLALAIVSCAPPPPDVAALRKHAMHAAAAVGLIALLGSASGFFKLFSLLAGEEVLRPGAVIAQSIMFVLSALFVGLAVNSFITARRNRQA